MIALIKKNILFFLSFSIAGAILILSVTPSMGPDINSGIFGHSLAYFVLSLTLCLSFKINRTKYHLVHGFFVSGSYGAMIEVVQYFIPYRCFDFFDMFINFLFSMIAVFPAYYLIKKKIIF